MAFRPESVIQGAPSGPTMTPCGAEPTPRGMWVVFPVPGSRRPSAPVRCAVYQTGPPGEGSGATSCGPDPGGTANVSKEAAGAGLVVAVVAVGSGDALVSPSARSSPVLSSPPLHAIPAARRTGRRRCRRSLTPPGYAFSDAARSPVAVEAGGHPGGEVDRGHGLERLGVENHQVARAGGVVVDEAHQRAPVLRAVAVVGDEDKLAHVVPRAEVAGQRRGVAGE